MGKIVIRISVIRYSGIIVCAVGSVRPLIDVIPSPVIAIPTKSGEAIPYKAATDARYSSFRHSCSQPVHNLAHQRARNHFNSTIHQTPTANWASRESGRGWVLKKEFANCFNLTNKGFLFILLTWSAMKSGNKYHCIFPMLLLPSKVPSFMRRNFPFRKIHLILLYSILKFLTFNLN